ncbi:MAG: hypothetical protein ABS79_01100 [Planctomycetes bacterium SCN 63-9]|nr:MAG: hypothetical protein ABS79_01100 [Planctomycetes bacterium SCN 63-9]
MIERRSSSVRRELDRMNVRFAAWAEKFSRLLKVGLGVDGLGFFCKRFRIVIAGWSCNFRRDVM